MVLVKIWPFSNIFFQALQARKMTFSIVQIEKTAFQAIKTRSSKSRKIDIFPKGLTHGFRANMAHFSNIFFQAILVRKMTFSIFENEKTPFQAIKTRTSKCRKIEDFPMGSTHGFGPQLAIFRTFFYSIQAWTMTFSVFQIEKNRFLGNKNKKFQKSKN